MTTYDELKINLIEVDGPERIRYSSNKKINLVNFLPQHYRDSATEDFLKLFESFLNEMFDGDSGFLLSEKSVAVNRTVTTDTPNTGFDSNYTINTYSLDGDVDPYITEGSTVDTIESTSILPESSDIRLSKISILEKIKRLADLQDPNLIDLEYIQFFAKNLGYNVDIYRSDVGESFGNLGESVGVSETNQNKYLRYVVENLPNWYKIKTTKNSIKVMLYSFGLIGDLIEFYTKDYENNSPNWMPIIAGMDSVDDTWYPTPHFSIMIDLDNSSNIRLDISLRDSVIRAIESIKPINTVFRGLAGKLTRTADIEVSARMRMGRCISIGKSDEYSSDFFFNP